MAVVRMGVKVTCGCCVGECLGDLWLCEGEFKGDLWVCEGEC